MVIKKGESYWHNASLQSIGVMMLLLLVLPSVIHGSEGRWTGTDWVVVTLGALLVIAWSAWTVVRVMRAVRSGRHGSELARARS